MKNIGVKVLITNKKIGNSKQKKNEISKRRVGRGGGKTKEIYETKKPKINSVGWQHTRVDNNKTNKAQTSRFYIPSEGREVIEGKIGKFMKEDRASPRFEKKTECLNKSSN